MNLMIDGVLWVVVVAPKGPGATTVGVAVDEEEEAAAVSAAAAAAFFI